MSFFGLTTSRQSRSDGNSSSSTLVGFVIGALSASLVWGGSVATIIAYYSRSNRGYNRSLGKDDSGVVLTKDSPKQREEDCLPRQTSNIPTQELDRSNGVVRHEMERKESYIEYLASRIGELPSKTTRMRWPWDKHQKKGLDKASSKQNGHKENGASDLNRTSQRDLKPTHHESGEYSTGDRGRGGTPPGSEAEKKSGLCIGSIFGLDVGGTLAKLAYFDLQRGAEDQVLDVARGKVRTCPSPYAASRSTSTFLRTSSSLASLGSAHSASSANQHSLNGPIHEENHSERHSERHSEHHSEQEPNPRKPPSRYESLPQDFAEWKDISEAGPPTTAPTEPSLQSRSSHIASGDHVYEKRLDKRTNFRELRRQDSKMRKSVSMFDLSKSQDHVQALESFYNFARRFDFYESGVKDKQLSFYSRELGGEFHFIRFETRRMNAAMDLIKENNLHVNICKMGATGGGAHKYADDWKQSLGIEMKKQNELDSLVAGMQFVLADVVGECYTFKPQLDETKRQPPPGGDSICSVHREWSRKVSRDQILNSSLYPYLLVIIGTGVSILRVDGPDRHDRVSGSTIGGGTYWGLCRLLTDVETFEDVLDLAAKGDATKVDMMVGDIYGQNTDALKKLGLPAHVVASSFGKLGAKNHPAEGLTQEDLARALLIMVTNNIGQVAYLNAQMHNTSRIFFVGNFLRHNNISQRRLAYAINYWSGGKWRVCFSSMKGIMVLSVHFYSVREFRIVR